MEPELDGAVGLSGTAGAGNSGMAPKSANSHISFGGFGAGLNPPALNHNLSGGPRPQPPADPYMQQYLMAATNHSAYPSGAANQHVVYPSSSLQPVASEDERAYAKYGQSNINPSGGHINLMRTQSSGPPRTGNAAQGSAPPSNRRPQSALDRVPHSASTGVNTGYFQQPQQGGGDIAGGPPGPAGISPGMYSAELRALMGSTAYNRPVSAPQNHHINAENIAAYQEATQRMKEKDERTKSTKELLESVYKSAPYNPGNGPPRTGSSAALLATTAAPPVDVKYILNPSNSGNIGAAGGGGRPGSAKWGATTGPAMSAVDRALSIGKGTAAYLPSNRGGDHHAPATGPPPRERARSAARRDRGSSQQQQQDAGRTLPLDNHVKQARLSEMFDEGILDKLDSAIGLPKR